MTAAPNFDVIVCGSLHLDIIVKAPAIPRIDETAVGSAWNMACGGKGGNQAVQAVSAGARCAMIGRVGDDDFGRTLRSNLTAAGVDTKALTVDPIQGSGMSVAILLANGDYGAVIVSGANTAIDPPVLESQWNALGGAKVLVLQNEVPPGVNKAAAAAARASGAHVVLNAAPARELDDDLAALVDVLIVNRIEAEAMAGLPVVDRQSARAAIAVLGSKGMPVVITLGGDGLVTADASGAIVEIAPVPVKVTSTHGAGDCFVGVLAARIAAGASLFAACEEANLRAGAYVSRTQ